MDPSCFDLSRTGGHRKEVWKRVKETLEKLPPAKTPAAFQTLLTAIQNTKGVSQNGNAAPGVGAENNYGSDGTAFPTLGKLFECVQRIAPTLYNQTFSTNLTKLQEWARQYPTHFPDKINLSNRGEKSNHRLTLSQRQCVYLLSAAFYGALPESLNLNFPEKLFQQIPAQTGETPASKQPNSDADPLLAQAHKLCAVLAFFDYHV